MEIKLVAWLNIPESQFDDQQQLEAMIVQTLLSGPLQIDSVVIEAASRSSAQQRYDKIAAEIEEEASRMRKAGNILTAHNLDQQARQLRHTA